MPAGVQRVGYDVVTGYGRGAFRGRGKAGEHAHGRRLARAVRPEESDDLSLLNERRHVDHGGIVAVRFRHMVEPDHLFLEPS